MSVLAVYVPPRSTWPCTYLLVLPGRVRTSLYLAVYVPRCTWPCTYLAVPDRVRTSSLYLAVYVPGCTWLYVPPRCTCPGLPVVTAARPPCSVVPPPVAAGDPVVAGCLSLGSLVTTSSTVATTTYREEATITRSPVISNTPERRSPVRLHVWARCRETSGMLLRLGTNDSSY